MKPNILLIHCHDAGDLIGPYPGNSSSTPNLDKLAADGVVFDRYFAAAPTCSPSRGSMFTGLAPHRNGLMALASGGHWEVSPEVDTLPELLLESGYHTGHYGIWHITLEPQDRGVEEGSQEADWDVASENAIGFLERRPADRPFFLGVGFREPHRAFGEPGADAPAAETLALPSYLPDRPEVREEMRRFYSDVHRMDQGVGKPLRYIAEKGLDDDTLVIFTSDHGIAMPLAKGTLYDPGIKIPLIVRWPGRIRGGRRCGDLASNVDLLPTILEAVGLEESIPGELDGRSLWPYLARGEQVGHKRIFSEQTWHDFYEPMRAMRTTRYKVIRNYETGAGLQIAADILYSPTVDVMRESLRSWPRPAVELYDLSADPLERHNLADEPAYAEVKADLLAELDDWLDDTDDPILKGVVPAPVGYWEHFCAKPNGPGALPPEKGREGWLTVRWPSGATKHRCGRG
jgi:N-sulfoglucosamine sulfohydrolase